MLKMRNRISLPKQNMSHFKSENTHHQVGALVQVVKHFGWTWIGVIAGDDAYGRGGASIFAEKVFQNFEKPKIVTL